jgi:hypothetical protein
MLVSGFPTSYIPGQTYTITITHNGGNKFVNVNATTRLGSTAAVAGSFIAGSNSALYTGGDGGVYTSPHLVDAIVFQWTAPGAGSGSVTFYSAGFQNTSTSSSSGQSSRVAITAAEVTTGIEQTFEQPGELALLQNYPNPFNPETNIRFSVRENGYATLKVFTMLGQEVATLFSGMTRADQVYHSTFDAGQLPSGLYFARLESGNSHMVQKMLLTK